MYPAGWYQDPNDTRRWTWWDGTRWRPDIVHGPAAAPTGPPPAPAPQPPSPQGPGFYQPGTGHLQVPAAPPAATRVAAPSGVTPPHPTSTWTHGAHGAPWWDGQPPRMHTGGVGQTQAVRMHGAPIGTFLRAGSWARDWVVWVMWVCGIITAIFLAAIAIGGAPHVVALSMVPAFIALPLLIWLDRHEPEPRWARLQALVFGGAVAIVLAGIVNEAVGLTFGTLAMVVISAPVIEEILKGLGVRRMARLGVIDHPLDGVIMAGWTAVGFTVVENVQYLSEADARGELMAIFVLRCLASPLAHTLFTAATGYGIGLAVRDGKRWAAAVGLVCAMGLHAMWNGAAMMGAVVGTNAPLLVMYVTQAALLVSLSVHLWKTRRRDHRRAAVAVSPLVASGHVSTEEAVLVSDEAVLRRALKGADRAGRTAIRQRIAALHRAGLVLDDQQVRPSHRGDLHARALLAEIAAGARVSATAPYLFAPTGAWSADRYRQPPAWSVPARVASGPPQGSPPLMWSQPAGTSTTTWAAPTPTNAPHTAPPETHRAPPAPPSTGLHPPAN
jgi:protease PrsW